MRSAQHLCIRKVLHPFPSHSLSFLYARVKPCNTCRVRKGRHFLSSHLEHTGSRMWPQLRHLGRCRQQEHRFLLGTGHSLESSLSRLGIEPHQSPQSSEPEWATDLPCLGRSLEGRDFLLSHVAVPGLPCPLGCSRRGLTLQPDNVCVPEAVCSTVAAGLAGLSVAHTKLSVLILNSVHWRDGASPQFREAEMNLQSHSAAPDAKTSPTWALCLSAGLCYSWRPLRLILHPWWRQVFLVLELEFWFKTSQWYLGEIFFFKNNHKSRGACPKADSYLTPR